MKKSFFVRAGIIAVIIIVIAALVYVLFLKKGDDIEKPNNTGDADTEIIIPVQIANPASTNCQKLGGRLVIEKRGDGGEFGLCYFEDNRACEEWALLRGDCPNGGVKTTGYDTVDQRYCAWVGGETFAEQNSVCSFKNGSKCPTSDFYNGTCEPVDMIKVSEPGPNQLISSPLTIKGEARGSWFFEASFPVFLVDWDGLIIAQGIAQAQGDWMTTELVPFEAKLEFSVAKDIYSRNGTIILKKDNPSGLPANDAAIEVPVVFSIN